MKCNLTCLAEHYIVKGEFGHHSLHTFSIPFKKGSTFQLYLFGRILFILIIVQNGPSVQIL